MTLPKSLFAPHIAHRGLWRPGGSPENSLSAFDAACKAGFGIELDVFLSADGEAVVFHDDALDRLTAESGLLEERTLEELQAITLLGGDHQHIPSLAEALGVIAGRSLVLIELKTPDGQEGPLEVLTAELLGRYEGPAAVLSFNARALACMARKSPETPRGINLDHAPGTEMLHQGQANFLSIDKGLANHADVQSWRAKGGKAVTWTVRNAGEAARLSGAVDNILFEGFAP